MPTLPSDARRSLFVYNLLFPAVFLALLPGFLRRMIRRGGFREHFGQRLGHYSPAITARLAEGEWWWIHSISVGETLVALKLARELQRLHPGLKIVISVTTSTGFALASGSRGEALEVVYNPIDARRLIERALTTLRPRQLILIEGEAWPNLLAACRERAIPVSLVNARLSPRSERRFARARFWVGPIFRLLDQICVPEEADLPRWQNLGVPAARLRVTGSVKFDTVGEAPLQRTAEFRQLLRQLGVSDLAPIIVAGSTWEPEEETLGRVLLALRADFPDLFLVIVPRHIERSSAIVLALEKLNLRVQHRTHDAPRANGCDVLLVDTTGELREWYAVATAVFVGKSLPGIAELGGQNPAEPAALGLPIVTGPHTDNFAALIDFLKTNRAIEIVADEPAAVRTFSRLLADAEHRRELGEHARHSLFRHIGATTRTCAALLSGSPACAE